MQRFEVARSIKMGLNSNILKRHTHFFLWCRQTFAVWRMFIQFLYTKVNSVYRNFWHLRVTFLNNSNKFSNLINVIKYLLATFACKTLYVNIRLMKMQHLKLSDYFYAFENNQNSINYITVTMQPFLHKLIILIIQF